MIYEIRLYDVAHGRLAAEVRRMHRVAIAGERGGDGPSMFDRYGIPRPLFAWTLAAGDRMPGFGYILRWESIADRERCFPAFWSDPDWLKIKEETDDGSPMVERIDDFYLRPAPGWDSSLAAGGSASGAVQDIIFQEAYQGNQHDAARSLLDNDFCFLRARGGRPFGLFEVLIGAGIPSLVSFVDWPDSETHREAWRDYHADSAIVNARVEEERLYGRPLFGGSRRLVVEPCDFAPPPKSGLIA
jgi:hypothetical protein